MSNYVRFDLSNLLSMIDKNASSQASNKPADLKAAAAEVIPARPKRCQMAECKMKIGLTDPVCKCSGFYCGRHRFADDHSCAFDYKGEGMNKLKAQLTEVRGIKLENI